MPLAKPVLGAMKKLGATLQDDAPSLATADLLAQVRWPSGELESRLGSKHWFEPLRLNFSIPRLYKDDPVGGGEEGPHLYVGGTDHQFLLLRERDRDEVDPEMPRAVGKIDQLRKERGVAKHHVVGVIYSDDQSWDHLLRVMATVVAPLGGLAIDGLCKLGLVVGESDCVMLRKEPGPPIELGLQRTQQPHADGANCPC